ncbi:orotate phosphoribosyltransferase [Ignisphaera aggregans DSM 17230]|uniref:Orotate phosphoribosyltransferase n=1 Tax=Ignisphaera aggregans (strain DSM 17230 / JCM 13409 / AQ1.S1) TaxID=583356 RepID=E0SQE6_IGNAA|nr:orotate phosphoribosyltransferase [Ignisphaera aggregans DSM 17230]
MSWLAIELYRKGMVKIGQFKLSSGLESPFYIDLRRLYSYPELMENIINMALNTINLDEYDGITGIATSGLVLASFIACRTKKPLSYVRLERKEYGTKSLVEGDVVSKKILIVDDVATTGSSIEYAYLAVKEQGGNPIGVFVVIDREQGARERLGRYGLRFYSLLTARELFDILRNEGYIDEEKYNEIIEYLKGYR